MRAARGAVCCAAFGALAAVVGCEFDKHAVGLGSEQLAVHGVLNPGFFPQRILVERTLSGRVDVGETHFDPGDPVRSGRGIPVTDARVVVYGPAGDSAVAIQDSVAGGVAPGVYRFSNLASAQCQGRFAGQCIEITPGGTYTLRVTAGDAVVTGSTVVPNAPGLRGGDASPARTFNRDRDSVFLFWEPVGRAHRYEVRTLTPFGDFILFVDSVQYLLSGRLRDIFAEGLPAAFVPGFQEIVTVGAVDVDYYDYYRSRNDPFTGRGLINHLQGGVGVFGAYAMLRLQPLRVTADVDDPFEGTYVRTGGASATVPVVLNLWIESRSGGATQVSGNYVMDASPESRGVIGVWDSQDHVTLALLRDQFVTDTVRVLEGRLEGNAIRGVVRGTGEPFDFGKR